MALSHLTFIVCVPRIVQSIDDKVEHAMAQSGWICSTMYQWAFHYRLQAIKTGTNNWIDLDALVFNKIRALFGGRLQAIINGSAPPTNELYDWWRVVMGGVTYQGYGSTETFGECCTNSIRTHDANILASAARCRPRRSACALYRPGLLHRREPAVW